MRQSLGYPRLATLIALTLAILTASSAATQQSQPPAPLKFEVAAIKPSSPGQPGWKTSYTQDTIHFVNASLKQWIEMAFSISDYALKAPSWLDGAHFDLDAKAPDGVQLNSQNTNEMLRNLLIDRFGLESHEEKGTASGYELVVGNKLLLKPSDLSDPKQRGGAGWGGVRINGHNMPMSDLAMFLGKALGAPVVDDTHISGGFEVNLVWRPDDDQAAADLARQLEINVDDLPTTVFIALHEQAGLRLQRAQVPSDILVIDNIDRQPTDN